MYTKAGRAPFSSNITPDQEASAAVHTWMGKGIRAVNFLSLLRALHLNGEGSAANQGDELVLAERNIHVEAIAGGRHAYLVQRRR